MQYLLTEQEYQKLTQDSKNKNKISRNVLQDLCTKVADHMPIKWSWGEGKETPKPWGCILTIKSEWYCDDCPVHDMCPNTDKHHSK